MNLEAIYNRVGLADKPAERYESLENEALTFIEERGAVDIIALNAVLAACYVHWLTKDEPMHLYVEGCPPWLAMGITNALGRGLPCPPTATRLAQYAKAQKRDTGSLWCFPHGEMLFEAPSARTRRALLTLREILQGRLDWMPSKGGFIWSGRVSCIIFVPHAIPAERQRRVKAIWPDVANHFTVIRFRDLSGELNRSLDVLRHMAGETQWAVHLVQLLKNFMDLDFRSREFRSKMPEGLFTQAATLAPIVKALRPHFDTTGLFERAVRLGMAHASLLGKPQADVEDAAIAQRVLLDAIPSWALPVLEQIPPDAWWSETNFVGLNSNDVRRVIDILLETKAIIPGEMVWRGKRVGRILMQYRVSPELETALLASGVWKPRTESETGERLRKPYIADNPDGLPAAAENPTGV